MSEIKIEDVIDIEEGGDDQERGIGSFKILYLPILECSWQIYLVVKKNLQKKI
jgi:hypothetical protein